MRPQAISRHSHRQSIPPRRLSSPTANRARTWAHLHGLLPVRLVPASGQTVVRSVVSAIPWARPDTAQWCPPKEGEGAWYSSAILLAVCRLHATLPTRAEPALGFACRFSSVWHHPTRPATRQSLLRQFGALPFRGYGRVFAGYPPSPQSKL